MIDDRPPRYRAYLRRCWEVRSERPGHPATWRFSLECAVTGRKRGFPDLEALVAYLERELKRRGNASIQGASVEE